MKEEQMRYNAHKRYYYYTNQNQNNNDNYKDAQDFKTPGQVLFFISVIVLTIFMFDALFVNYSYQADMKRMNEQHYSPTNRFTQKELQKKVNRKMTKEDEDEIDKQINVYKEIEDSPNIRIYKSEPFANSYDQRYAKK